METQRLAAGGDQPAIPLSAPSDTNYALRCRLNINDALSACTYVLRKVAGLGTEQLDEAKSTYTPT